MTPRARRLALLGCLVVGIGLRGARVLEHPFIHADGPGYIDMARRLGPERWRTAFTGYYPPLYAVALRAAHATGLDWEAAGRAVALVCGVVIVGLTDVLGSLVLGPAVGLGAAALAAVHPHLVHGSAEVLAETLYGLLVVLWAILLIGGREKDGAPAGVRLAAAAALGAFASLARVEGTALAPLTSLVALWDAPPGARIRRVALTLVAAALVLVPVAVIVRLEMGVWAMSGKEVPLVTRVYGVKASGMAGLILGHPLVFLSVYPKLLASQILYMLGETHVLLLVPIALGLTAPLVDARARRARRLVLATLTVFALGIATINPGKRYTIPLIPLLLPWAALGAGRLVTVAARGDLGRAGVWAAKRAPVFAAVVLVLLGVEGLRPPERETEACHRSVCAWVAERFGTATPAIMAEDGRIAYLCGARFLLQPHGADNETVVAAARARGAGLWVARAPGLTSATPGGLTRLAERCNGAQRVVIFGVSPAPPG